MFRNCYNNVTQRLKNGKKTAAIGFLAGAGVGAAIGGALTGVVYFIDGLGEKVDIEDYSRNLCNEYYCNYTTSFWGTITPECSDMALNNQLKADIEAYKNNWGVEWNKRAVKFLSIAAPICASIGAIGGFCVGVLEAPLPVSENKESLLTSVVSSEATTHAGVVESKSVSPLVRNSLLGASQPSTYGALSAEKALESSPAP